MDERLKLIRRHFRLSQESFAGRLGIKRSAISNYEIGRNVPIDAVVSLICHEFNVNETWLRTGEGEMFDQQEESIIDRLCAELHASELDAEIIRAYFRIDPKIREPFMRGLLREVQSKSPAPAVDAKTASTTPAAEIKASREEMEVAEEHARWEQEARAEAEKYTEQIYEQILSEKKAAAGVLLGSSAPKAGDGIAKMA